MLFNLYISDFLKQIFGIIYMAIRKHQVESNSGQNYIMWFDNISDYFEADFWNCAYDNGDTLGRFRLVLYHEV